MNLSISVGSPNPINYPSPSPQHPLPSPSPSPSPSPESQGAQTPPPPPPPESKISVSEFFLLSEEERNKIREKKVAEVIKQMKEDQENGCEAPFDPEHHNPGFRWRRERGLSVPADYAWPVPEKFDPDDWKDIPVIPHPGRDGLKCEICGRGHYESCCPYWFEFPAGGVLRNTSDYIVVCECGEDAVDGCCPGVRCHPSNIRYVVPRPSSPQYSDCPSYEDSPARDSPTIVAYSKSFSAQGSVT